MNFLLAMLLFLGMCTSVAAGLLGWQYCATRTGWKRIAGAVTAACGFSAVFLWVSSLCGLPESSRPAPLGLIALGEEWSWFFTPVTIIASCILGWKYCAMHTGWKKVAGGLSCACGVLSALLFLPRHPEQAVFLLSFAILAGGAFAFYKNAGETFGKILAVCGLLPLIGLLVAMANHMDGLGILGLMIMAAYGGLVFLFGVLLIFFARRRRDKEASGKTFRQGGAHDV